MLPILTTTDTITNTATDTTQTGVIQFNNTGLSALAYPNCGGTCLFAIGRLVPSSHGTTAEAVAGVVWQLRSPENTRAEAQRLLLNTQSENLTQESTLILTENSPTPSNSANPNASPSSPFSLPNDLGILTTTNCFNNSIGNKTVRLAFPMRLIS